MNKIWLVRDGQYRHFRVTVTSRSKVRISGHVDEVVAWDPDTHEPLEFGRYLAFYLKWDGCGHVWFGNQSGYLHLCGASAWEKHNRLMAELFEWARAHFGATTEPGGASQAPSASAGD